MRWRAKSAVELPRELFVAHSIRFSDETGAKLRHHLGYSLKTAQTTVEGKQHPDRTARFEHIAAQAKPCVGRGVPFISADTKKELVGNFTNAGVKWQPKDAPEVVDVLGFPSDAHGRAIPDDVYDVADSSGFVNVETDHDTQVFAVTSLDAWWNRMGRKRHPDATAHALHSDWNYTSHPRTIAP